MKLSLQNEVYDSLMGAAELKKKKKKNQQQMSIQVTRGESNLTPEVPRKKIPPRTS